MRRRWRGAPTQRAARAQRVASVECAPLLAAEFACAQLRRGVRPLQRRRERGRAPRPLGERLRGEQAAAETRRVRLVPSLAAIALLAALAAARLAARLAHARQRGGGLVVAQPAGRERVEARPHRAKRRGAPHEAHRRHDQHGSGRRTALVGSGRARGWRRGGRPTADEAQPRAGRRQLVERAVPAIVEQPRGTHGGRRQVAAVAAAVVAGAAAQAQRRVQQATQRRDGHHGRGHRQRGRAIVSRAQQQSSPGRALGRQLLQRRPCCVQSLPPSHRHFDDDPTAAPLVAAAAVAAAAIAIDAVAALHGQPERRRCSQRWARQCSDCRLRASRRLCLLNQPLRSTRRGIQPGEARHLTSGGDARVRMTAAAACDRHHAL